MGTIDRMGWVVAKIRNVILSIAPPSRSLKRAIAVPGYFIGVRRFFWHIWNRFEKAPKSGHSEIIVRTTIRKSYFESLGLFWTFWS